MTTATNKPPTDRERYIALLGSVASLLNRHPEVPKPYVHDDGDLHFVVYGEGAPQVIAAIRRVIGGKWDKKPGGDEGRSLYFTGKWHGFGVLASVPREDVCIRRVVGTEERPVEKVVTPAVTETVMEPVEIIEWICEPVLAPRSVAALDA